MSLEAKILHECLSADENLLLPAKQLQITRVKVPHLFTVLHFQCKILLSAIEA